MELTIREAATILGRSPRTVRAQVARGDIPGHKRNGRWQIPRQALPLTEAQRRSLQGRTEELRRPVTRPPRVDVKRSMAGSTRSASVYPIRARLGQQDLSLQEYLVPSQPWTGGV